MWNTWIACHTTDFGITQLDKAVIGQNSLGRWVVFIGLRKTAR